MLKYSEVRKTKKQQDFDEKVCSDIHKQLKEADNRRAACMIEIQKVDEMVEEEVHKKKRHTERKSNIKKT